MLRELVGGGARGGVDSETAWSVAVMQQLSMLRAAAGSRGVAGRGWCLAMYWTTPSGTRYQTGSPRIVRRRQSVELIASAGTSTIVTRSAGILPSVSGSIA